MEESTAIPQVEKRPPLWRSFGPALITACVVLGPGSLLVGSNLGANHGYELLWLPIMSAFLMGTYMLMAMRIGVIGGATPCTLLARHVGRPFAAIIGINLCLICASFQYSNNLALATAINNIVPALKVWWILVAVNGLVITFIFTSTKIYKILERMMKTMVGVMLVCFVINVIFARPEILGIFKGLIPHLPEGFTLTLPKKIDGVVTDPMILVAALLGTSFSVGAAFFQGNFVRERGWKVGDYIRGTGDTLAAVCVLTLINMIIITTAAAVIFGKPADSIGTLAQSLRPLLGPLAGVTFSIGLLCVSMNPFLINSMIGGAALADGLGKPARLSDKWPRRFTIMVLLIGMVIALIISNVSQVNRIRAIIFAPALTVIGNPLMASTLLYLANKKAVMGEYRNRFVANFFGCAGLLVVIFLAVRVFYRIWLQFN